MYVDKHGLYNKNVPFFGTPCIEKRGRGSNRDKVEDETHHLFISLAIQNTYQIINNITFFLLTR